MKSRFCWWLLFLCGPALASFQCPAVWRANSTPILTVFDYAFDAMDCDIYYPLRIKERHWEADGWQFFVEFDPNAKFQGGVTAESNDFLVKARVRADNHHLELVYDALSRESDLHQEVLGHVDFSFGRYDARAVVLTDRIAGMRAQEENLDLDRCSYFVYSKNGIRQVVMRLFDGTVTGVGDSRSPTERDYPQIRFPERDEGVPVYDIGRLGTADGFSGGVAPQLRRIAEYFYYKEDVRGKKPTGVIYISATESGAKVYQRYYGFSLAFGPEELGTPKNGKNARFLLKITVEDFMKLYSGELRPSEFELEGFRREVDRLRAYLVGS